MQIANHLQSGTTVKNIQPTHLPFTPHRPNSDSSDNTNSQFSPLREYRISRHPNSNPNHVTETGCLLQRNGYSIHLVNSLKQRIKASTLIKRMYASRGYQTESASVFSHTPSQFTFMASIGDVAAGTVTLRIDSAEGLLADELYFQEINDFRVRGKKVCELSKFALDPQYSSKEMIASLFQIAYIYARVVYQATDFFCEVNPRHVLPQKRMFGFQQIGRKKICPRVNAPAVLLHLDTKYIEERIANIGEQTSRKEKNLYPYFFPLRKEKEIVQFIQARQGHFTSSIHKVNSYYHPKYFQPI